MAAGDGGGMSRFVDGIRVKLVRFIGSDMHSLGGFRIVTIIISAVLVECGDPVPFEPGPNSDDFQMVSSVVENPHNNLSALVSVQTSSPAEIHVVFSSDERSETSTAASFSGTDHEVTVVGLRANTTYTLRPIAELESGETVEGEELVFATGPLPTGIPDYEVTVHNPSLVQPGITLFGVDRVDPLPPGSSNIFFMGVDEQGEVVWYYRDAESSLSTTRAIEMLPDGTLLLVLHTEFRIITIGGETVTRVVNDEPNGLHIHHDVLQLVNGNFLTLSHEIRQMFVEALGGDVSLRGDTILEVTSDGTLVWEWNSFDVLDTERFPGPLSQNPGDLALYDWTHGNAISYLEDDDTILFSSRHQNWIIKVGYPAGDIEWRLGEEGDFTLVGEGEWFYSQHSPQMHSDGTILIYDNGNERPGEGERYSRVVRYRLDEDSPEMTAEQIWEYRTDQYTMFLGDADHLPNDNILVCAGGPDSEDPVAQIIEVTAQDPPDEVWELTTSGRIYRATRIPSFWPER